jgi:hypothetical protein
VGVENYLLGLRPAPERWLFRLYGAEADKDRGVRTLELTAQKGHYLQPLAQLLLAVAALRDKDSNRAKDCCGISHRSFRKIRCIKNSWSGFREPRSRHARSRFQTSSHRVWLPLLVNARLHAGVDTIISAGAESTLPASAAGDS